MLPPKDWIQTKLGDIAEINMGQSPTSDTYNLNNNGLPFYQGIVEFGEKYVTPKVYTSNPLKIADAGDILLSVRAPVGRVNYTKEKCCIGRGNTGLRMKNGNQEFLYYLLIYSERKIQNYTSGTVFEAIGKNEIFNLPITIPNNNDEQRTIAKVLSVLDDKIELLRSENKTLEKMAQTIFKHWFIDFEFPDKNGKPYKSNDGEMIDSELGKIPKGWRVGKLGDLITLEIGGDWGEENKTEGLMPVICLRGIDLEKIKQEGYSIDAPIRYITIESLEKRQLNEKDILIGGSGLGPIGKSIYYHKGISDLYDYPLIYSNFCKKYHAKTRQEAIFIEYYIERLYKKGKLEKYYIGTSIPNFDGNGLLDEMIIIPDNDTLLFFSNIIYLRLSKFYNSQLQTLTRLRDTLLPKLMSGEIRVKL